MNIRLSPSALLLLSAAAVDLAVTGKEVLSQLCWHSDEDTFGREGVCFHGMALCRNGRNHKHRREAEAPHRSQRPAWSPHHSKTICVIYQVWLYQHQGTDEWIFRSIGIFDWGDCVVCKCVCILCVFTGAHGGQMLALSVFLRNQPPWHFFPLWVCFFFGLDLGFETGSLARTWVSTEEARVTVSWRPHLLLCPGTGLMRMLPTQAFFFFSTQTQSSSSPHGYTINISWLHCLCRSLKHLFVFKYVIMTKITT